MKSFISSLFQSKELKPPSLGSEAVGRGSMETSRGSDLATSRTDTGSNALSQQKLDVGGDLESVFSALGVEPESLALDGTEGVAAEGPTEPVELKNSKGEVAHLVSPREAAHYESAGLRPEEVNRRECLVRDDIDWSQTDQFGETNRERSQDGRAPLDPDGRPYELHHVQQRSDGMLAELTRDEHRGAGIDRILHDPAKSSEINRPEFDQVRTEHWRARSSEVEV